MRPREGGLGCSLARARDDHEAGRDPMAWVLFDYGGVICTPQPDGDVVRLASVAGVPVPAFRDAYWAHRLDYDPAELDGPTYCHKVAPPPRPPFPPPPVPRHP